MTITNHILAGAIIGPTITNPVVAVVLGLTSHFAMDALPHFGYAGRKGCEEVLRHKLSYIVAIITLATTLSVLILLLASSQWFALLIGLIAALPDAIGIYNWQAYEKHGKHASDAVELLHVKFHRAIQWCERPWGVWTEGATFIVLFWILVGLL